MFNSTLATSRSILVFLNILYKYSFQQKTIIQSFEILKSSLDSADNSFKRETISKVLAEVIKRINEIDIFITSRIQDMWPDLYLYLLSGTKPVGICNLSPIDFAYSETPECVGIYSRRRRTFIFKSMTCTHTCQTCGCIFAKVDGWIWVGLESERPKVLNDIGWMAEAFFYTPRDYTTYNCKVFVYQAKIRPGNDEGGLCDPKLRVSFMNCVAETSVINATLSPIWNEVISFKGICIPGTIDWFSLNPPYLGIELFDEDARNTVEYIGCGTIKIQMGHLSYAKKEFSEDHTETTGKISHRENEKTLREVISDKLYTKKIKSFNKIFPPPLRWTSLVLNGISNAEVLISVELLEVGLKKTTEEPDVKVVQGLPQELVPKSKRHKYNVIF